MLVSFQCLVIWLLQTLMLIWYIGWQVTREKLWAGGRRVLDILVMAIGCRERTE